MNECLIVSCKVTQLSSASHTVKFTNVQPDWSTNTDSFSDVASGPVFNFTG